MRNHECKIGFPRYYSCIPEDEQWTVTWTKQEHRHADGHTILNREGFVRVTSKDVEKGSVMEPAERNAIMDRYWAAHAERLVRGGESLRDGGQLDAAMRACDKSARVLGAVKGFVDGAERDRADNTDEAHWWVDGYNQAIKDVRCEIERLSSDESIDELDSLDRWINDLSMGQGSVPLDILREKIRSLRKKRSETQ